MTTKIAFTIFASMVLALAIACDSQPEPTQVVQIQPTSTATVIAPTDTPTPDPTETATPEPTATSTIESTSTPLPPTATNTPQPAATNTPDPTSTPIPLAPTRESEDREASTDSKRSESDVWEFMLGSYEEVNAYFCSQYEPGRIVSTDWLSEIESAIHSSLPDDLSSIALTPEGYYGAMAKYCPPVSEAQAWELLLGQDEVRSVFCDIYDPLGIPTDKLLQDSTVLMFNAWNEHVNLGDLEFTEDGYHLAMQTHCPSVEAVSESDVWAMIFSGVENPALLEWFCDNRSNEIPQERFDLITSELAGYLPSIADVALTPDGYKDAVELYCPVSQGANPSRLLVTSEQEFWDIVFIPDLLGADTDLSALFCEDTSVMPDAGWLAELEQIYRERFFDQIDFGDHSLTVDGWIEATTNHCVSE